MDHKEGIGVSVSTLRAELAGLELRLVQKLAEKEDVEKIADEVEDRLSSLEAWRNRSIGVVLVLMALGVTNFVSFHFTNSAPAQNLPAVTHVLK